VRGGKHYYHHVSGGGGSDPTKLKKGEGFMDFWGLIPLNPPPPISAQWFETIAWKS